MEEQSKEQSMTEFKDSNWVHYAGWVANDDNLSLLEAIAYSTILGFSQDGKSMFMGSAGYLAIPCKCTREHMTMVLKGMVQKGYLQKVNHFENGINHPYYKAVIPQGVKESSPFGGEPNGEAKSKVEPEIVVVPTKDSAPKTGRKSRREFVPPTRDELVAYMKEKDLHFDVDAFFRWYSPDWVDTKGKPVKDWKGRARAWDLNNFSRTRNNRAGSTETDSEQIAEIANKERKDDEDLY